MLALHHGSSVDGTVLSDHHEGQASVRGKFADPRIAAPGKKMISGANGGLKAALPLKTPGLFLGKGSCLR